MNNTDGARGNELQQLRARLASLEALVGSLPARLGHGHPSALYRHFTTPTAHGFAIGDIVRNDGTAWVLSLADTAEHAYVGGMVVAIPHPKAFVLATPCSYVFGQTLTPGINYLSDTNPGKLTATQPAIRVPVVMADSASTGVMLAGSGGGTAPPDVAGKVLNSGGDPVAAAWSSNVILGGYGGPTGSLTIVTSNDGDTLTISSTGITFYDASDGGYIWKISKSATPSLQLFVPSVSTSVPMIDLTTAGITWTIGKAIGVREEDYCDGSTPKKQLVVASAPYVP